MYSPSILHLVQEENPLCPLILSIKLFAGESQQKTFITTITLTELIIIPLEISSFASVIKSRRKSLLQRGFSWP